ncbi:PorV/PorQ family protein [Candidatus Fermentibacteria bacterium]|nr:PorV/PorQ family protein [Candidatus Fermentibacteria bacterium]
MLHRFTATVLVALTACMLPQPAQGEVGTAVVFLLLAPGARARGMGQAFVAVSDDATAAFYNPGGLALTCDEDSESRCPRELFLMHSPWMPVFDLDDLYLEYFAYTQHVPGWGHFAVSANYLHVGEVMETDENNNELGMFRVYDIALNLSYSTRVTSNMGVGGNLKYIRSQLHPQDGVGSNWAVDVGWLYRMKGPGFLNGLRLGASLSNVGPEISYRSEAASDPLPRLLRVGLAYEIMNRPSIGSLLLSTEFDKVMVNWSKDGFANEIRESQRCIGAEYKYADVDDAYAVFLRGGYYYDREAPNVPKGATFGGGLKYKSFQFDFAFIAPPEDLGSTYTKMYSLRVLI